MNVLVLGSGGRENALAWKIYKSPLCTSLFCMPGNPGTASLAVNLNVDIKDFNAIRASVLENNIELVVVGPEDPLVNGLRDFFKEDSQLSHVLFVGPDMCGAKLEGSKDYAKHFMQKYNIPTAEYKSFGQDQISLAKAYLETLPAPYVLKADGLAAGKGVLIIDDLEEAKLKLEEMLKGLFGSAGSRVVIERFLKGIELSVFILTDGKNFLVLPEAKDYKRINDGDKGLNTGGMGAVSPLPFATPDFMKKVESRVIIPTLKGLVEEHCDYRGFIFFGLMNCNGEPYVIEYNVRMGDPETEAVMTRIDSDFLSHLIATASCSLSNEQIKFSKECALTVVCVSGGYPQSYNKGMEIEIDPSLTGKGVTLFHSGTKHADNKLLTNGGRVFALTVNGSDITACRNTIYSKLEKIHYNGLFFRHDIGVDILEYDRK